MIKAIRILEVPIYLLVIALGVVIGIYIVSQISSHIDNRSRHKELMKNLEEWDKKQKTK